MEFWASPEQTVARIDAHTTRDQLVDTGHFAREGDVALLAGLGIDAARYPVLWEHAAPDDPAALDLSWAARRLEALRARGVAPIATLLHHGWGPRYTGLLDDAFPALFAAYAGAVARRFPWIERWLPISEPLTTARFSTLYGLWHPNRAADDAAFGRAIVNEADAMLRAMERIRAVIPRAQFVLTEDLQSFTAGDAGPAAFVAFKRERAFLSIELVMGRVRAGHPMHAYLTERCGIAPARLRELAARATPPDLVGFDYYPHSERYLFTAADGTWANVPRVYVPGETVSPRPLLAAAFARLGLPMALSEVHLRGSEAERTRWLLQRHGDALALAAAGVPLVALGAWAAFGLVDWHVLLRERRGIVEDGVFAFAAAGEEPRATLVAETMRRLTAGESPAPPDVRGWWEAPDRWRSPEALHAMQRAGRADGDHLVTRESAPV